jgi:D-alanyl-D-alanine dipeptidase
VISSKLLGAGAALLVALGAATSPALAKPPAVHAAVQLPPIPSPQVARLVGDYGSPEDMLVVYERDGGLYVARGDDKAMTLAAQGGAWTGKPGRLAFEPGSPSPAVTVDGVRLVRRDIGAETQAKIRAGVHADAARLRAEALAASPPMETNRPRPHDLVPLSSVDPGNRFDIRYATTNNFMGIPLYERAGAYMQRPAAEALGRVQRALAAKGYGLLIHDAYRPWFVTKMFWDATPPEGKVFVADPAEGSRHNRGCAVDLTLYDLKTGKTVEMTGRYDEMSKRSYADYPGGTSRQRFLRELLRGEMEKQGFSVYPEEWWHFDYKDWDQYPIGDVTFTQLDAKRPSRGASN